MSVLPRSMQAETARAPRDAQHLRGDVFDAGLEAPLHLHVAPENLFGDFDDALGVVLPLAHADLG